MSWELWLAFTIASTALLAIPGPTVMIVVSYALGKGPQSGWATVPGLTLGDFVAMTVSLLGAGAILAASAELFTILKLAGAGYLVWLGIKLWRSNPAPQSIAGSTSRNDSQRMFWNAFVVTALNPKGIVFFIAFVPQFVDTAAPVWPQFIVLELTFLTLAAVNGVIWAILAGHMRARFQKPSMLRLANRIGGSFLIGAGVLTAFARRTG